MAIEVVADALLRSAEAGWWGLAQELVTVPSMRQTARDLAGFAGILLLAGLWLYLAIHWDRRTASLVVVGMLGLAYGAGYALGRESRLEPLREMLSYLLLFFEVFIDLPRGLNAVSRTVAMFLVTGVVSISAGSALAASLPNAGPAGEVITELLIILFF